MFNNERILITGCAGWLGEGIALALIEAGAHVICHHRSQLPQSLSGCDEVVGDLGSVDEIARIADEIATRFGTIAGLVNNAAAQPVTPFEKISESEFDQVLGAGLKAPFFLTQKLAPLMPGGSVVNIASIEAENPPAGHSHYGAAKAGLVALTKTLSIELAPLRVNSLLPGLIDRPGLREQWPEGVARWISRAPSGRLVDRSELAQAVIYLLGGTATGISLRVDGGIGAAGW